MMYGELETLQESMRHAGHQVLRLSTEGFETYVKKDRSPVTSADLAVNDILRERLSTAYPQDAWLSEETPDDGRRFKSKRVWIIDPIDGTKYFMRGVPQYAISAALVDSHRPIVAAVYNPATDELFTAVRGQGAWLNGNPIAITSGNATRPIVLVNPSSLERGQFRAIQNTVECRPMGSIAYTLALVAAGQADATLNLDGLNEWDIAAGALLVEAAGGFVVDREGNPILFNRPTTTVHGIVAADKGLVSRLLTFNPLSS